MSQATTWGVQSAGPATMAQYAARDNAALDALLSAHRGASRPAYAVASTIWVKAGTAPVTDAEIYYFDGTNDILIATVNESTNAITFAGLEIGTDVQAYNATLASLAGLSLAAGDVLYATGADTLARLPVGTAGQALTVNSGATAPEWASPTVGKIRQVLQTVKTDTFASAATGAWTDITGLSVAITPSDSNSNVLVRAALVAAGSASTATTRYRLVRDSTVIGVGDAAGDRQQATTDSGINNSGGGGSAFPVAMEFLDSPSTDSEITYKVQFFLGAGTTYINRAQDDPDSSAIARYISTITVEEIGA